MAAIEVIVFAGAAGFAVIVVATILVIIGVRQEQAVLEREGRRTFAHHEPPTILALLARRVLGAHFNVMPVEVPRRDYPKPNLPDPEYFDPDHPDAGYFGPDYPDEDPPSDGRPVWPEAG
jgi:hypothetical protein